jgi:SAM-dependent methyltransferase
MTGEKPTNDIWGRTTDVDAAALAVMAQRLENRAKHPFFRGAIADYIGDLDLARTAEVLEIGAGTGIVARRLAATAGFRGAILATDVSAPLLDAGRRLAAEEGLSHRVAFALGGAAKLDLASGRFDLVIAHTLLSHADDPVGILAEAARVLRPDGRLLIFDRDFASSALSLEPAIAARIDLADVARAFAAQPLIIRHLPKLLREAGFAIEKSRSYVVADIGKPDFFAEQLVTWRKLLPVSGVIDKADADRLMDALNQAADEGRLFWSNNFYTLIAGKTR